MNVYDVESGERLLRFPASEGPVDAVAYSPDGKTIATAGDDGTVRLFDAEPRDPAAEPSGSSVPGDRARLQLRRLAARLGEPDGVVRVWALDLDDLIGIAETQVTRELSDDECRQYLHQTNGCE